MANIFDFMKDKKKSNKEDTEKYTNYSCLSPVGEYDESENESSNPYSLSAFKDEDQLIELKRSLIEKEDEVKVLNDKIKDMNEKYNVVLVNSIKYEYAKGMYRNLIEKIVKILPYYKEIEFSGIGNPEQWKDRDLVDLFSKSIEDIKIKYSDLQRNYDASERKRKEQMEYVNKLKSDANNVSGDIIDISMSDNDIEHDKSNEYNDIPMGVPNRENEIEDYNSNVIDMSDIDNSKPPIDEDELGAYVNKMSDNSLKIILKTIGETGLSRIIDLKEIESLNSSFLNKNGEFGQAAFTQKIQSLVDMMLLEKEVIKTGRKGGIENIYTLTDLGIAVYNKVFGTNPVEGEKYKIKRQHTSLEHGYFIKAVSREFKSQGYTVLEEPKECQIKIEGTSLMVEADLRIQNGDEDPLPIECEMGTTSDADMTKKLDKYIQVSKIISIIVPNSEAIQSLKHKLDKWITKSGGSKKLKGYTFRITTLDNLKKKYSWNSMEF